MVRVVEFLPLIKKVEIGNFIFAVNDVFEIYVDDRFSIYKICINAVIKDRVVTLVIGMDVPNLVTVYTNSIRKLIR